MIHRNALFPIHVMLQLLNITSLKTLTCMITDDNKNCIIYLINIPKMNIPPYTYRWIIVSFYYSEQISGNISVLFCRYLLVWYKSDICKSKQISGNISALFCGYLLVWYLSDILSLSKYQATYLAKKILQIFVLHNLNSWQKACVPKLGWPTSARRLQHNGVKFLVWIFFNICPIYLSSQIFVLHNLKRWYVSPN